MKIYTKTGDAGETGIVGTRVSKAATVISVLGLLDELNSAIGVVISDIDHERVKSILSPLQSVILEIGAAIAHPSSGAGVDLREVVANLEIEIDELDSQLSPLVNFILPGGDKIAARFHWLRAICRRTEREIVELSESQPASASEVYVSSLLQSQIFLNRLSDWLFVEARYFNKLAEVEDQIWRSSSNST